MTCRFNSRLHATRSAHPTIPWVKEQNFTKSTTSNSAHAKEHPKFPSITLNGWKIKFSNWEPRKKNTKQSKYSQQLVKPKTKSMSNLIKPISLTAINSLGALLIDYYFCKYFNINSTIGVAGMWVVFCAVIYVVITYMIKFLDRFRKRRDRKTC